jgi:lysophospholipid hydrolase
MRIGLEAGREALKEWKDKGKLPSGLVDDKRGQATVQRGNRLR